MSVWADMYIRSTGKQVKKEDLPFIDFDDALNYTEEEKENIRNTFRNLHISPVIFPLRESTIVGKSVLISAERKTYQLLFKERFHESDRDWDKLANVNVLGEYKKQLIILYINNIKEIEHRYGDLLSMMRYVYLHELMHAFFDRTPEHKYIFEIEEAFAEFGALICLYELVSEDKADQSELDWALSHVDSKKCVLPCYSYGSDLFNLYKEKEELAKRMLQS